jgi:hypothetical protein
MGPKAVSLGPIEKTLITIDLRRSEDNGSAFGFRSVSAVDADATMQNGSSV